MKIMVHRPDGSIEAVRGEDGLSVMEALRKAALVEGECEGALACASCHVWIEPEWADRLPPPEAAEEDMLDVAFNLKPTSRLSCQIMLTDQLDGLALRIPASG